MNHRTHAVLVRDLYPHRLAGDEPGPIEVIPWPLNTLDQLVQRDDFSESRSLAALYITRDLIFRGNNYENDQSTRS